MFDVSFKIEKFLKKQFEEEFITLNPETKVTSQISIIQDK